MYKKYLTLCCTKTWREIPGTLIVKTVVFLLLLSSLQMSASTYAQRITLQRDQAALSQVLKDIQKITGYHIFYDQSLIDEQMKVSFNLKNAALNFALSTVLAKHQLSFRIVDKNIIITKEKPVAQTIQERIITGKVLDETGEPLSGATVKEKGTSNGTITDPAGSYKLEVPSGAVLLFSYTGYATVERTLNNEERLDVNLFPLENNLENFVVVGYGSQKKKDITGSVVSVPQERLEMVPNINISQALQGSVPGVVVQQSVGGSNPQSSILIRGRNSILASNEPLIILDGIAYNGNLSDLNVNEVSSIEVLKDASAAAIYGSRGANGVIIITTKTGKAGDKTRFSYDGKYALQKANNMPKFMTPEEFYAFKEIREPGSVTSSEQKIYNEKSWSDWSELALRDGNSINQNLSVSGVSGVTNFYLSGNYLKVNGQTLNDSFERVNGRVSVQTRFLDYFKIGTNTQISSGDYGGAPVSWENVLRINPLTQAYHADGSLNLLPWEEFTDISNPLDVLNHDYTSTSLQLLSNNFLQLDIPGIKGMSYRMNLGIHGKWANLSNYRNRNTAAGIATQGLFNDSNSDNKYLSAENILTYTKTIGSHNLDITALYSYEHTRNEVSSIEASGFPNDFTGKYAIAQASFKQPGYDFYKTILQSQMLRVNYNYRSKYLLTLTGRRDGFSGFGENKKWGIFPSLALGWNIAEEAFGLNNIFQELKLRGSYGLNGNQAVGAYQTISRLSENNLVSGDNSLPGYVPSKLGQEELGWESSKTLNLGLDLKLRRAGVSASLNYYHTNTYDLLLNRTISPVHGITSITQNIGKTNNQGIEALVSVNPITTKDLNWSVSGNMAYNKNKIVSLYGLLDVNGNEIDDLANQWFIGQPITTNYDWRFIGVWQTAEAEEAAKYKYVPGDAKFEDVNSDYQKSEEDKVFIGQRDPKFTWGLTNTFRYKGVALTAFLHGIHGITRRNELLQDASASSGVRRNVISKNWWTPENPTNEFFANSLQTMTLPIYEDASFIRLKDITLSYDFTGKSFSKIGLNNLRVYMNMRNLATITDWSAHDPELSFGRGAAPLAKEYVLGLSFNFN